MLVWVRLMRSHYAITLVVIIEDPHAPLANLFATEVNAYEELKRHGVITKCQGGLPQGLISCVISCH